MILMAAKAAAISIRLGWPEAIGHGAFAEGMGRVLIVCMRHHARPRRAHAREMEKRQ
jgi:hypothetical protein